MSTSFFTLDELGLRSEYDSPATSLCPQPDDDTSIHAVFEINGLATLAELQPLWNDLLQRTPQHTFGQTLEWLQLYWTHFRDHQRLRVLCLENNGETVGLTILVERESPTGHELTLPSVGSETHWPLGTNSLAAWRAVGDHLRSELSRKHILDLRGLPDPQDCALRGLQEAGLPVRRQPWMASSVVRMRDDFGAFWSEVSPSLRSFLEAGEQRLPALGPSNFVRFRPQATERTSPQFPAELYQDCLNIALSDEQQLAQADSVLNAPQRHRFLRDLLPWAWQHAAADLCLLLVGSRPVAFRFHTVTCGRLQTVWTGADAEFRSYPLAALLLHRTLCDSARRGDTELDLGPTPANMVSDWNATQSPNRRIVAGTGSTSSSVQQPEESILHGY